MASGEWIPVYISLLILILIGLFVPVIINSFIDVDINNYDGFLSPFVNLVNNGIPLEFPIIGTFNINVFNIFGEDIKAYFLNSIISFTYLPQIIAIPLIIFVAIGFIYVLIYLMPFT